MTVLLFVHCAFPFRVGVVEVVTCCMSSTLYCLCESRAVLVLVLLWHRGHKYVDALLSPAALATISCRDIYPSSSGVKSLSDVGLFFTFRRHLKTSKARNDVVAHEQERLFYDGPKGKETRRFTLLRCKKVLIFIPRSICRPI